jgi:hypothetical protein
MIELSLSVEEVRKILECLQHSNNKELYSKFWRILISRGEKLNGLS